MVLCLLAACENLEEYVKAVKKLMPIHFIYDDLSSWFKEGVPP